MYMAPGPFGPSGIIGTTLPLISTYYLSKMYLTPDTGSPMACVQVAGMDFALEQ